MGEARSGQGRRRVARPRWHRCATVAALVVLPVVGLLAPPAAQAVGTAYVVDGSAAACSDTGPGTPAQPFCTIGAATRKSLVPGDSVTIAPGVYREQVNVPSSGTPAAPITFRASGPGVLVLGTKDLGSSAWTAAAAPAPAVAWQTAFAPASTPRQVFLAGTRLSQAASASTMGTSSWFYDSAAKVLLVDLGGPSPAGQLVEAGAQSYGLSVVGRHDVLLTGIDTRGANYAGVRVNSSTGIQVSALTADQGGSNGVLVEAASSSVVLDGLTVTNAVSTGIRVSSSSAVTVRSSDADHNGLHGIGVTSSPQLVLTGNTSHDNAATSGTSTAAGIDVSGSSTDAQVVGNTVYGNQDTGIQIGSGADRPLVARNLSHHNGDHGIHVLGALNASLISNSVTANKREGVALEGGATGARLADNLLTDNGQGGGEADLLVDAGSQTGLVADYDLALNPTTRTAVRAGSTSYKSLLDYAATTGQEAHGLASDPGFADPANGDLRLTAGSVAVDSADAGVPGFVGTAPWTPVDDPAVPDRGAGVPTFADRGALEYLEVGSANHPPHAALMLNPAQVAVPPSAQVSVDASGSSDPDDYPIQSYAFDFGDGTSSAPQPGPVTSHAYDTPGTYTVTVTVTDTAGAVGTA
ncbi:MAG: right-handed parallel beta-helix repeat-containing protein, partial [Marmoricola sp.]|nr:right-handed parallel beta-helix repeat-containing protein [Marmoricola sp.]